MAYTRSNTNAAHVHPVITIYVEEVSGSRVTYKLWHQKAAGKSFMFSATIGVDRATLETLEPGRGYQVVQTVDQVNCTHWTSAHPYAGGKAMRADVIVERVAAKQAVRRINADGILSHLTETVDF